MRGCVVIAPIKTDVQMTAKPELNADVVRVREALAEVYTPDGIEVWLVGRNQLLGGARPIDLIHQGETEKVLAVIAGLADGVVF